MTGVSLYYTKLFRHLAPLCFGERITLSDACSGRLCEHDPERQARDETSVN
jgi:hypothetical protein